MDNVFHKGFLPTKDKKCTRPFKNKSADELMTYEEVKNLPEFAGILAEDTVLIDIDDMEQSEIMMQIVEEKELMRNLRKKDRHERKTEECPQKVGQKNLQLMKK